MENTWREYDPRCDDRDVALRATAQCVERNRWDLLEDFTFDHTRAQAQVKALSDYYGRMNDPIWRNPEMMQILRKGLSELVPVAQSMQMLYGLVTHTETKIRRIA